MFLEWLLRLRQPAVNKYLRINRKNVLPLSDIEPAKLQKSDNRYQYFDVHFSRCGLCLHGQLYDEKG